MFFIRYGGEVRALKKDSNRPYVAVGITAFCVIAAAILFFFLLEHAPLVGRFLDSLAHILRPIFLGMIFAFLLLPIHRNILRILMAMTSSAKLEDRKNVAFLNFLSILFSLVIAVFLLYLLLVVAGQGLRILHLPKDITAHLTDTGRRKR